MFVINGIQIILSIKPPQFHVFEGTNTKGFKFRQMSLPRENHKQTAKSLILFISCRLSKLFSKNKLNLPLPRI